MSDRRLWLEEPCPTCGARSGLRCQTSRYGGKPTRVLHAARGWRQPIVPDLQGAAGRAVQDADRPASRPAAHGACFTRGGGSCSPSSGCGRSLSGGRPPSALVRFSGGGGSQGSIAAVTLEDAKGRELARWGSGEGELPEALAAPVWARYALFRGHPRISGLLMWDVQERQVVIAGERGGQKLGCR